MDYFAQTIVLLAGLFPKLVAGFVTTLALALAAMPLALAFGLLLLLPRMEKRAVFVIPTVSFIELMRNTPLLLQVYLIYFGLPLLGLYPSGDAARGIGMGRLKAFRHVILPQALLRILGPLGNQLIILIKDTSLVSAIGVMELTMTGKMAIERSAASAEIFVAIALFYLVLTTTVGGALRLIEHRTAGRY